MFSSPTTMMRRDRWNRYPSEGTFRRRLIEGAAHLLTFLFLPPASWAFPLFADIAHERPDEQSKACKKRDRNKPREIHDLALVRLPEGQHPSF
jgi:hypothetical protein